MIKKTDLDIYPYHLWFGLYSDEDIALKKFKFFATVDDMNEDTPVVGVNDLSLASGMAATYCVREAKNSSKGVLILFNDEDINTSYKGLFDVVSHESGHAADIIWQSIIGIGGKDDFDSKSKNEPYMYLLGTIAGAFGSYLMELRK